MSRFFILLIQFYRWIISPVIHSLVPVRSGCRFPQTCSEFFIESLQTEGAVAGTRKGLLRLARCHPLSVRTPSS